MRCGDGADVSNEVRRDAAVLGILGEGYDSIHGQGVWKSASQGNLNYDVDELVVYNQAQAIPSYLVVYAPANGSSV